MVVSFAYILCVKFQNFKTKLDSISNFKLPLSAQRLSKEFDPPSPSAFIRFQSFFLVVAIS